MPHMAPSPPDPVEKSVCLSRLNLPYHRYSGKDPTQRLARGYVAAELWQDDFGDATEVAPLREA